MLSKNADLTASAIRSLMRQTAEKIGGVTYIDGFNKYYGYGRVNARAAVEAVPVADPEPEIVLLGGGREIVDGDTDRSRVGGGPVSPTWECAPRKWTTPSPDCRRRRPRAPWWDPSPGEGP